MLISVFVGIVILNTINSSPVPGTHHVVKSGGGTHTHHYTVGGDGGGGGGGDGDGGDGGGGEHHGGGGGGAPHVHHNKVGGDDGGGSSTTITITDASSFTSAFSMIDTSKLTPEIVSKISSTDVNSISKSDIISFFASLGVNVNLDNANMDEIKSVLPTLASSLGDIASGLGDLASKAGTLIANIDVSKISPDILAKLPTLNINSMSTPDLQNLLGSLGININLSSPNINIGDIKSQLNVLLPALGNIDLSALGNLAGALPDVGGLVGGLTGALPDVGGVVGGLTGALPDVGGVVGGLTGALPGVVGGLTGALPGVVGGLTGALGGGGGAPGAALPEGVLPGGDLLALLKSPQRLGDGYGGGYGIMANLLPPNKHQSPPDNSLSSEWIDVPNIAGIDRNVAGIVNHKHHMNLNEPAFHGVRNDRCRDGLIDGTVRGLRDGLDGLASGIKSTVTSAMGTHGEGGFIGNALDATFLAADTVAENFFDGVYSIVSDAACGLGDMGDTFASALDTGNILAGVGEGFKEFWFGIGSMINDAGSHIIGGIGSGINHIANWVDDPLSGF